MYCSLVVVILLFRFCSAFFVVVRVANSPCAPAVIVGVLCLYCRFALIYPRFFAVTTTGHTSIGNIFMGQYFFRYFLLFPVPIMHTTLVPRLPRLFSCNRFCATTNCCSLCLPMEQQAPISMLFALACKAKMEHALHMEGEHDRPQFHGQLH
jgi:hypothetical protein